MGGSIDELLEEMLEHICDKLCKYPNEADEDELEDIYCECEMGRYINEIKEKAAVKNEKATKH